MIIVRWADDFVIGFQHGWEAQSFLEDLRERFKKFSLELHPEKTRLIRFGRYAKRDAVRYDGRRKPETFNFLGFTHQCRVNRNVNRYGLNSSISCNDIIKVRRYISRAQ